MAKTGKQAVKETPLMKQFYEIKAKHPDALLLFRVGDFYETFGEDAIKASKVLGITLTKRKNGAASSVELAGFPYHSLDAYLPRLVRAGLRVAICEQLEDPKATKTIVKRGITELVTPGVALNEKVLDGQNSHYLAALVPMGERYGMALLDVSTGAFFAGEGGFDFMHHLLGSFEPREVLVPRAYEDELRNRMGKPYYMYPLEAWIFERDFAEPLLNRHFGTQSMKGFGIDHMDAAVVAAGTILHYLAQTRHEKLPHLNVITRLERADHLWLDPFTIRNLELVESLQGNGVSLFDVLNETQTPMGARKLRHWLLMPLRSPEAIEERLNRVQWLVKQPEKIEAWKSRLSLCGDVERLTGRLATGRLSPRELPRLAAAIREAQALGQEMAAEGGKDWETFAQAFPNLEHLAERIEQSMVEEPPAQPGKGPVFAEGFDPELDEYRKLAYSGKDVLLKLQENEAERTGINSLKLGFNQVFGYYLEVTNAHKSKVPEEWIRKQTLVNAERYITPELKTWEEKILGAEEKILGLETRLYQEFLEEMLPFLNEVKQTAQQLASLDVLCNFAGIAFRRGYRKPEILENHQITILEGRHPVIEHQLPAGEKYIPNSLQLDGDNQQILIITGPNMAGKSALLRQTALIVLMAQAGSFVPAEQARIGWTDRIFTRVGASDNLSQGESTFMVEMSETAAIMNNLSDRSLVLLDEIGRGTSTYDGISIAWSLVEFLHDHPKAKAKTLFATHYHELNDLERHLKRVKNYHVSVKESNGHMVFLRKLAPGGTAHSFGIQVARMAGMPLQVVRRSEQVLKELEASRESKHAGQKGVQLSFIQLDDPGLVSLRDAVENVDVDHLTPVEALVKLHEIKRLVGVKETKSKK